MKYFIVTLFLLSSLCLYGNTFKAGAKLYTIETRHFDFIFSEESKNSAQYLASIADSVFDEITALLHYTNKNKIPVVITPDTDSFNGYATPLPYIHLVLYDTPMDPEWTTFSEPLKYLFIHELTHAVTMDIKCGFMDFFYGIFGAPFDFTLAFQPEYMVEGVTVSFESRTGYGRANDPLIQEEIRQDIYENEFLSPLQVSGSRDIYPYGNSYYHYGGLFSKYLQDKYGMEKYAEYWHGLATLKNYGTNAAPSEYDYWFYSYYYEAAFGKPLKKLWADFKNEMTVKNVADNPDVLSRDYYSIASPVISGDSIYFIDNFSMRVLSYSIQENKYKTILDNAAGINSLSISEDGKTMMLNMYRQEKGLYKRMVRFLDLKDNKFLPKTVNGIYDAQFFKGGIIALKADTHKNSLVYIENDKEEILLSGTESVLFSTPVMIDARRIGLIMIDRGNKKLTIYDLQTRELTEVKPLGAVKIDYIRTLEVSEGRLLFGYNSDHEFYKLGILDSNTLYLQTNNYSGGVFYPLLFRNEIYYTGKFSRGDKLLKYPVSLTNFNGLKIPAKIEKQNNIEENISFSTNVDHIIDYNPFKYMSPFHAWLILPTSSSSPHKNDFWVDSVGIFSLMTDPVDENNLYINLGYNYLKNFANAGMTWSHSSGFPADIGLSASDKMVFDYKNFVYYRESTGSFNLSCPIHLVPVNNYFILGTGVRYYTTAPDTGSGGTPYLWPYGSQSTILSALAGFSSRLFTDKFFEDRGFSFTGFFDYSLEYSIYKTEAAFFLSLPFVHSHLSLYGAYCPSPVLASDSHSFAFGSGHYPAYMEFISFPFSSQYYLTGEFALLLFNAELQNGWFPLYFNRLFCTSGYRAVYLDNFYLHSLFARLNLQLSAPAGILAALLAGFYAETAYVINNNQLSITFGVNIPLPF